MKTKVCIYARVSTLSQDYERQLSELREYASRMNYEVVKEFSEKISGAKSVAERQALTELLDYAATNRIDKVLVYECSRISRRAIDFLQVIDQLTQMKVSVYILQSGLETLMADGSVNPSLSWYLVSSVNSTLWSVALFVVAWKAGIIIFAALVERSVEKSAIVNQTMQ